MCGRYSINIAPEAMRRLFTFAGPLPNLPQSPRMTYGPYSGGSSLAQKKEAIEKLSYPKPTEGGDK